MFPIGARLFRPAEPGNAGFFKFKGPASGVFHIFIAFLLSSAVGARPAIAADITTLAPEQYAGKAAYIDFWASWRLPCKKSFPWMAAMAQKYGHKGFVVITVNLDKNEKLAREFLAEFPPAGLPVIMDPQARLAREWKLAGLCASCAGLGVDPWDRDLLAQPAMSLEANMAEAAMTDKMYYSKEASSGGKDFAGGGCGCN